MLQDEHVLLDGVKPPWLLSSTPALSTTVSRPLRGRSEREFVRRATGFFSVIEAWARLLDPSPALRSILPTHTPDSTHSPTTVLRQTSNGSTSLVLRTVGDNAVVKAASSRIKFYTISGRKSTPSSGSKLIRRYALSNTLPERRMPSLPLEVQVYIVKMVLWEFGKSALVPFGCVCKEWGKEVRLLIYRTLVVPCDEGPNPFSSLTLHIDEHPQVAPYIIDLTLRGEPNVPFWARMKSTTTCEGLYTLVSRLPFLQRLTLLYIAIMTEPYIPPSPIHSVNHLRLSRVSSVGTRSVSYNMLRLFEDVKKLDIYFVHPDTSEIIASRAIDYRPVGHAIAVDQVVFQFPMFPFADHLSMMPSMRTVKKASFRHLSADYIDVLNRILSENSSTLEKLELLLPVKRHGRIDVYRDWDIVELPRCTALQQVMIVLPMDNMGSRTRQQPSKLSVVGKILSQLPPTVTRIRIVLDFNACTLYDVPESIVVGLNWRPMNIGWGHFVHFERLEIVLYDPNSFSGPDWSDLMLMSVLQGLQTVPRTVDYTFHMTPV